MEIPPSYDKVGAVTPAYDGNGNLISDGTFALAYDAENRLVSASGASNTAAYAYDAQGRCKLKAANGTKTIYFTDADNREVLKYNGSSGAVQNWYAYGLGSSDVLNRLDVVAATTHYCGARYLRLDYRLARYNLRVL